MHPPARLWMMPLRPAQSSPKRHLTSQTPQQQSSPMPMASATPMGLTVMASGAHTIDAPMPCQMADCLMLKVMHHRMGLGYLVGIGAKAEQNLFPEAAAVMSSMTASQGGLQELHSKGITQIGMLPAGMAAKMLTDLGMWFVPGVKFRRRMVLSLSASSGIQVLLATLLWLARVQMGALQSQQKLQMPQSQHLQIR